MRFEQPPRPPQPPTEDGNDHNDDEGTDPLLDVWFTDNDTDPLSDPWFTAPETPHSPETILEQLRKLVEVNRTVAVAFTAATVIATACSSRLFETQPNADATDNNPAIGSSVEKNANTRLLLPDQIEISQEKNDLVIMLGGERSIRITDWTHRELWDRELTPETGNPTFAWHRDVLEHQYTDSFNLAAPAVGIDPIFMQADEYPSFATIYGNMEIGNYEVVTPALVDSWLTAAKTELHKNFNKESDLYKLTAAEWMYVLQAPTKLLKYDKRLASVFPEYDANFTSGHWHKNIQELMSDGIGVCRDNERLMVTSYIIANQLFDLADNGLLYLPMINIVDAKHTRGAFYLSINPVDMVMVGVDTTYGGGNIQNSFTAALEGDVAIWHSQQYNKDLGFSPYAQITGLELFQEYSDATDMDISPVAQAILRREKREAQIKAYEAERSLGKKTKLIEEIHNNLFAELGEDSLLGEFPLNLPSRLVHMYDQLIYIATEWDSLKGKDRGHEATAKSEFADYLSRNGVDAEAVRKLTHQIDRLPTNEREARLEKIQEILEKHTSSIKAQ